MTNRKLSLPILSAMVLFLVAGCPFRLSAQSGVPLSYPDPAPAATAPPSGPGTTVVAAPTIEKHTMAYTVAAGDSLTSIARKFDTTRKKLRALNDLALSKVTPGQTLLVPAPAAPAKAKAHHTYLVAQPVQDFDVPASTFASCPVPLPSPDDDPETTASGTTENSAPVAKLVSPSEMAAEAPVEIVPTTPLPPVADTGAGASAKMAKATPAYATGANSASVRALPLTLNPPPPRAPARTLAQILGFGAPSTAANDWGSRFLQQARALGNKGIEYDDDWRPPGESRAWTMDCSNTSRYLYKVTAGIQLPRTASDQYYYLHLQGKAWDVPLNDYGLVDTTYLREHLKPGDLLFWENTYRPERQPPITHVMVYLGVNDKGQWIMAGSQSSRGGEHNRPGGGPDVYVFRPSQPCGGYTTWMGLVHHHGRFCAFGRPLEADPSKLAVAESD